MKFFKKSKKGFTLVELIVVIAIVAILAAVSVVSYIAFINKGNESADIQLVKQLNTCLQADEALNGKRVGARADYEDIEHMLEENGFIVENLTKTKSGLDIVYQPDPINRFALLDGEKLVYGESAYRPEDNAVMIWNADTKEEALAFAQAGKGVRLADGVGAIDEVNTSASFYVGNNSVGKINYVNNGDAQTVSFTTNGGDLVVNGKSDTVNHYAYLDNLTVEHVNSASYHEYGTVRVKMTINDGHVVMEENSSVNELIIPETEEGNAVSIDIKDEVEVESLVIDDQTATVTVAAQATVNEVVGETSNISGAGASEATKPSKVTEKTLVYNEHAEGKPTIKEAMDDGADYIVFAEDITVGKWTNSDNVAINVTRSIKIDGNGHTLKTSAGRGIWISENNVELTVKNLTILGTASNLERAIQVNGSKVGSKVNIDNVVATATMYAFNVCNYSDVDLTITNSTITGWGAINLWGDSYTVYIGNSTLVGINDKGYNAAGWNDFGTVILEGDTTQQTDEHASNIDVKLVCTKIKAVQTTGNQQWCILFNNPSAHNNVYAEGCTFEYNDKEHTHLLLGENETNHFYKDGKEIVNA